MYRSLFTKTNVLKVLRLRYYKNYTISEIVEYTDLNSTEVGNVIRAFETTGIIIADKPRRLGPKVIGKIIRAHRSGVTMTALGKQYGVSRTTIRKIIEGKIYKHIEREVFDD